MEVARNTPTVLVRDTKDEGNGPVLRVAPVAWDSFLEALKTGEIS